MSGSDADLLLVAAEFDGLALGDARRNARVKKLANALAREPDKSFPRVYEDDAAGLAGLYRLFSNDRVSPEEVRSPHVQATLARCREAKEVIAAHDTTDFDFGPLCEREGLGPIEGMGLGFHGHFTLMVTADEAHRPLGVSALKTWSREPLPEELKGGANKAKRQKARPRDERESQRWKLQVGQVEKLAAGDFKVIHVCDREADDYDFFASLLAQSAAFVVRVKHDRCIDGTPSRLREKLAQSPVRFSGSCVVSPRKANPDQAPKAKRLHPSRSGRTASLAIHAEPVVLIRPYHAPADWPPTLKLNVLWVHETDCPAGEEPIEWLLYTNEPIETEEQVRAIIRHYRGRWRIEEYFKALKTGCAFERRQLGSYAALTVALGIFLAIAWRLLLLRSLAREEPEAPAGAVLSPVQIQVLAASLKKTKLPPQPTVRDVLMAIAALGGFLKHNKEPGWITLGRGYEKLLVLEQGWRAHSEAVASRMPSVDREAAKRSVQS